MVVPTAPLRSLHLVPAGLPAGVPSSVPADIPPPDPAATPRVVPPGVASPSSSLRLTRRGRLVLTALAMIALAAVLAVVAPAVAQLRSGATVPAGAPAVVVVQPGDTLWSIARRVAPDRDARLVVADLRRLNALPTADVQPGQRLEIRQP